MLDNFYKNKRIFVTGGTGFIGGHLVKKLVSLGANVKLFAHNTNPENIMLEGYRGDIAAWTNHWRDYLIDFKPEIVFHLAAQAIIGTAMEDVQRTCDVNIKGTYNLFYVLKQIEGIKSILHVATDKIFSDEYIRSTSEADSVIHPYNASKVCGDIIANMYRESFDLPVVRIRHGNVYGPNDLHWDRIIPGTIKACYDNVNPHMRGEGKPLRDYIYVDDIVDAYLTLAKIRYYDPNLRSINLGSHRPYHVIEVMDKILELTGHTHLWPMDEPLWRGELVNQHIDNHEAEQLIGWNPQVKLDEGLTRTVDWYTKYLNHLAYLKENECEPMTYKENLGR